MSNRPTRTSGHAARRAAASASSRNRTLLIAGAAVALVVVIGLVVALLGGADDNSTTTTGDQPAYGPVTVDGTPLPTFESTSGDPAIGQPAPVLDGRAPDGSAVTVGGQGTPTMVAYLAHWCPHCQRELPLIVQLMADGDLEGTRVVAVLTGTNPDRPNFPPVAWLEREHFTGDVLLDDDTSTAAQAYGLSSYPFLVFLDGDGNVVGRTIGEVAGSDIVAMAGQAADAG